MLTRGCTEQIERSLLRARLRRTSRSFYLSVQILPSSLRRPVALAYLLARMADTLADSWPGTCEARCELLLRFRAALKEGMPGAVLAPLPRGLPPSERHLLAAAGDAVNFLRRLPRAVRPLIVQVVTTLTEGMLFDLHHFRTPEPTALPTYEDLSRYTYLIAGCVGAFWTDIAVLAGAIPRNQKERLSPLGIAYGKGLQLINILRDMPRDLRRGRVYLPEPSLASAGLTAAELARPQCFAKLKPLYHSYLSEARRLLASGHAYVCGLPRCAYRLRLATLWPLWIGLATLNYLEACPNPLRGPPLRVPRRETYRLLATSLAAAPSNTLLEYASCRLSRSGKNAQRGSPLA